MKALADVSQFFLYLLESKSVCLNGKKYSVSHALNVRNLSFKPNFALQKNCMGFPVVMGDAIGLRPRICVRKNASLSVKQSSYLDHS